jgi:hypothetical protein
MPGSGEDEMNSGLSIVGVLWVVAAFAAVAFGWRRGNWIVVVIGILMFVVAGWNTVAHRH